MVFICKFIENINHRSAREYADAIVDRLCKANPNNRYFIEPFDDYTCRNEKITKLYIYQIARFLLLPPRPLGDVSYIEPKSKRYPGCIEINIDSRFLPNNILEEIIEETR